MSSFSFPFPTNGTDNLVTAEMAREFNESHIANCILKPFICSSQLNSVLEFSSGQCIIDGAFYSVGSGVSIDLSEHEENSLYIVVRMDVSNRSATMLATTEKQDMDNLRDLEIGIATLGASSYSFAPTTSKTLSFAQCPFPIGAIYSSVDSENPSVYFANTTWVRFAEGRMLLSANSTYQAGSTGGEAAHTLTAAEMPTHRHALKIQNTSGGNMADADNAGIQAGSSNSINTNTDSHYTNQSRAISDSGGGQPHNNMPPYISVYMWKRTA